MVAVFLAEWPQPLTVLRDAITAADTTELTRAAHTLNGALGSLGAVAATEVVQRLEVLSHNGALAEARAALAVFEEEMARLLPVLTTLAPGHDE
jgi:HPt (histidine-containing phosphotransfer) domain-containing protein